MTKHIKYVYNRHSKLPIILVLDILIFIAHGMDTNRITSNVANMSPTHFRGPPPNGKYLEQ